MGISQVSSAGSGVPQTAAPAGKEAVSAARAVEERTQKPSGGTPTLSEMMKDAKEKADARRDQFQRIKPKQRYGDAPIEAYARLARAKNQAGVNSAASYARRKIVQLQSAKRTDSENARQIQGAINQLRKAVTRAGKKKKELMKEQAAEKRQVKLAKEKKLREARRQRQELRRTQALRTIRESGYVREAEVDSRMQSYISKTQLELRNQAQALSSQIEPSLEAAVQQYAFASATADSTGGGVSGETVGGGEVSVQA